MINSKIKKECNNCVNKGGWSAAKKICRTCWGYKNWEYDGSFESEQERSNISFTHDIVGTEKLCDWFNKQNTLKEFDYTKAQNYLALAKMSRDVDSKLEEHVLWLIKGMIQERVPSDTVTN